MEHDRKELQQAVQEEGPLKKRRRVGKVKKVVFQESDNNEGVPGPGRGREGRTRRGEEDVLQQNRPPRHPQPSERAGYPVQLPKPLKSSAMNSRQSSVENYDRYYGQNQAEEYAEDDQIEPTDFKEKSRQHYQEYLETQKQKTEQQRVSKLFEPQFIRDYNYRATEQHQNQDPRSQRQAVGSESDGQGGAGTSNFNLNWIAKPTKEGFLYFTIPGTNTYQWSFPQVYNHKMRQSQYLFISHWLKKEEPGHRKYWYHKDNINYKQYVKPHAESYLIEAAIEGNLAFLEVYTKFQGDLGIRDQQGRSALVHAISNNHLNFVSNLCEYSTLFQKEPSTFSNLLELTDRHGNTALFTAIRFDLPACLEILISYKCNFFHRKRNGNTCLHDCAVYNSMDCLTMLASYCGRDLFQIMNKDGNRAIDIAMKLKNQQILYALQKLDRNLTYQNAVLDRQTQSQKYMRHRGFYQEKQKTSKKPKLNVIREEEKYLSSVSNDSEQMHRSKKRSKHKKRRHSRSPSGSLQSFSSSEGRLHLEPRSQKPQSQSYRFDERKHFEHLGSQRQERKKKKRAKEHISFKKYKEEYLNKPSESDELSEERTGQHMRSQRQNSNLQDSKQYLSQMRKQKAHQDQYFGEDSYFKPEDLKERSRSKLYQEDEHYKYQREQDSEILHQVDKSYFEMPGQNSSNIDLDAPASRKPTEMYNSRMLSKNNYTIDDIEKQRFRVKDKRASAKKERPSFDGGASSYREQGQSMVEQAFVNATRQMFSMASYVYTGYEKLKQFAVSDTPHSKPMRSKSARERRNSWDRLQEFQNKYGKQKSRQRSRRYREASDDQTSEQQHQQRDESSFDELDFRTAYGRSQSRARSQMRSRSRLHQNQEEQNERGIKIQTETIEQMLQEETETKSIGIQADSFVKITKRKVKKVTKKTEISRHSIGVGSICVDQTFVQEKTQTIQDQTITSVNRKLVLSQLKAKNIGNVGDFSRGSIASQKLQHSQMINFERGRRTGKKLGLKAQQILMENKHFQSSEDEKAAIEESIKMSDKIEPQPQYLKHEVQFIKMSEAFEKQNAQEYNNQLQKMKEYEKEQSEKLSNMTNENKKKKQHQITEAPKQEVVKDQIAEKQPSSTTLQSTQRQNSNNNKYQLDQQLPQKPAEASSARAEPVEEAKATSEDIADFYQKLLYNSLSQTEIDQSQLQTSIAEILEDKELMKMLKDKVLKKSQSRTEGDVEQIDFNPEECDDSLLQDTLDLELGGQKISRQKEEQFEYFLADDQDSLNLALEGSLLRPFENFGECLSDCTFILQDKQSYFNDYGSRCNSNVFEKGQFLKGNLHNSCYSTQGGNLSLNLNTLYSKQQLHNSGFGLGAQMTVEELADDKVPKAIHHEFQIAPIPKPQKGARKLKPRKNAAGSMYSAAASEQALEESLNCLSPAKIGGEQKIEEADNQNIVQSDTKSPEQPLDPKPFHEVQDGASTPQKETKIALQEAQRNPDELEDNASNHSAAPSSTSSLQPGCMTKISDEDITPIVDKAIDQSDIEFSLNQSNSMSSRAQIAENLLGKKADAEPSRELLEAPGAPALKAKPIQIFKASTDNSSNKNALVSTRYQEQEECSVLDNSEIKLKKTQPSEEEVAQVINQESKKETTRRPKATRYSEDNVEMSKKEQKEERKRSSSGQASRSLTRSEHRVKQDLLSGVKKLFESQNKRTHFSRSKNDKNDAGNKTKREVTPRIDLSDFDGNGTKVDFDLTQLNQTSTTPRPGATTNRVPPAQPAKEKPLSNNAGLVQSNAKLLQEIQQKLEKEAKGKFQDASAEYSLSFDMSTILRDKEEEEKLEEEKEASSGEKPTSQQNPVMSYLNSYLQYEPTSSDPDIQQALKFIESPHYPSESEARQILKPPMIAVEKRADSQDSKKKLKIKLKQMSASSNGTDMRLMSDIDKQERKPSVANESIGQFLMPFGRAYTSSDDESRADVKTAKFQAPNLDNLVNNSVLMEASNPMAPTLRDSTTSMPLLDASIAQSAAVKTLAEKLSRLKKPTGLKAMKDISFKGSNVNLSSNNFSNSVMTDNSERLRENLSALKRIKETKAKKKEGTWH